jgi:methylated-DNA-[protein]-cysteine S-methyltransferase
MNDRLEALKAVDVEAASRRAVEATIARARRGHLVDVSYATVDTPVGSLLLAATPQGLVRVAFPEEDEARVLEELAEWISPRVLQDSRGLDRLRREVDEYFSGRRRVFREAIDWRLAPTGFSRRVLEETARIPYGSASTYGEIARRAGSPRAARAAGTPCTTTRCRSSCRVTAWSRRAVASGSTAAASGARRTSCASRAGSRGRSSGSRTATGQNRASLRRCSTCSYAWCSSC